MAIDLPAIRQRITVDGSALDGLQAKFGKVGGVLGKAVAVGAGAAAVAIGGFVTAGVKGAIDVERGLREVNSLFGVTGEEGEASFRQLQAGVADLSAEVGVAQQELTGGLYQAISAGVPRDNVFEFMQVAAKAAIGGVTDTETAIDGMTTTINAFGLEASDAQAVADSMFATVKGGKTTFGELSASLSNVAPAAAAAGVKFTEVNAAIATLTAAGVPTAQATTQIRAALVGLQKPSTEMNAIFAELGYESAQAAIEAEGMGFALDAVAKAADGDNGKLTTLLGSVEAVGAVNVLAGTGAEKFAAELEAQANSAGAATTAFEEMEKGTGRSFERLKVGVMNAAIAVGSVLLPPIASLVETLSAWLIPVLEQVSGVVGVLVDGDFWQLARMFGATTEQADALHAGVSSAFGGIGEAGGVMADIISSVKDRIATIVETIQEVVAENLDVIRGAFDTAKERIGSIMDSLAGIIDGVLEAVAVAWELFGDDVIKFVTSTFNAILRIIDGALRMIKGVIDLVLGILTGDWGRAWDGIKGIVGGAWDVIMGIVDRALATIELVVGIALEVLRNLWDSTLGKVVTLIGDKIGEAIQWFKDLPGRIVEALGDLGTLLLDAGKNVVQGLIDGITSKITAVKDAISGVVGKIRDALPWSPAKEGPLRRFPPERGGRNIGEALAEGLDRSRTDVAAAAGRAAAAIQAGLDSATGLLGPRPAMAGGGSVDHSRHYNLRVAGSPVMVDEAELVRILQRVETLAGVTVVPGA